MSQGDQLERGEQVWYTWIHYISNGIRLYLGLTSIYIWTSKVEWQEIQFCNTYKREAELPELRLV